MGDSESAGDDAGKHLAGPRQDIADTGARRLPQSLHIIRIEPFVQDIDEPIRLTGGRLKIAGKLRNQLSDLRLDQRHQQDNDRDHRQKKHQQNDKSRDRARQPQPLQTVRQRIKEEGDRETGDERQQDTAQQPKQHRDQQETTEPEPGPCAAVAHARSRFLPGAVAMSGDLPRREREPTGYHKRRRNRQRQTARRPDPADRSESARRLTVLQAADQALWHSARSTDYPYAKNHSAGFPASGGLVVVSVDLANP